MTEDHFLVSVLLPAAISVTTAAVCDVSILTCYRFLGGLRCGNVQLWSLSVLGVGLQICGLGLGLVTSAVVKTFVKHRETGTETSA